MYEAEGSRIGQVLNNTYELLSILGKGGMGEVYLARHRRTEGHLAIKLLRREVADSRDILRRFQEEARILSALSHPNLLKVFDLGSDERGRPYLAMELLAGENLEQRCSAGRRLALKEFLPIVQQIGSALQAAHDREVVHRDIKPENIFLCAPPATGGSDLVKVLDFGVAKVRYSLSPLTQDAVLIGTPSYMAPEVIQGHSCDADHRADQWSLAVLCYRVLSGCLPFSSPSMQGLMYQITSQPPVPLESQAPGLPPAVYGAVDRALSKGRDERFPSIMEFVRALESEDAQPRPRAGQRRDWLAWSLALLGVAGVLAAALWLHARPGSARTVGVHATATNTSARQAPAAPTAGRPPDEQPTAPAPGPRTKSAGEASTPAVNSRDQAEAVPRKAKKARSEPPVMTRMPWTL